MQHDPYRTFADRYDWMLAVDPERERFFRHLMAEIGGRRVLDCACGTGRDLLLFHDLGCDVRGSDRSAAMLAVAGEKLQAAGADIPLHQLDYRDLTDQFAADFDAVVCLANAINEMLDDEEALRAITSMRAVLRPGGVLVLDQGQTDATMRDPPEFTPVVNTRDHSRLMTLRYEGRRMQVDIFDFVHDAEDRRFAHERFVLRVRLADDWTSLLEQAGFRDFELLGGFDRTSYDRSCSRRLIAVARR